MSEIELERKRGQLVPVQTAVELFGDICRTVRDGLLSIPPRCAPMIAAEMPAAAVAVILKREIGHVLKNLSEEVGQGRIRELAEREGKR